MDSISITPLPNQQVPFVIWRVVVWTSDRAHKQYLFSNEILDNAGREGVGDDRDVIIKKFDVIDGISPFPSLIHFFKDVAALNVTADLEWWWGRTQILKEWKSCTICNGTRPLRRLKETNKMCCHY